jgi:hypothetical protein
MKMARLPNNLARPRDDESAEDTAIPSAPPVPADLMAPAPWPRAPGDMDWDDDVGVPARAPTELVSAGPAAETVRIEVVETDPPRRMPKSPSEPVLSVSEEFFIPEGTVPPPPSNRDFSDLDSLAAANVSVDPRRRELARKVVMYVMGAMGVLLLVAGVVATVKSQEDAKRPAMVDGAWITNLGGRLATAATPAPAPAASFDPDLAPLPPVLQTAEAAAAPSAAAELAAPPVPKRQVGSAKVKPRRTTTTSSKATLLGTKNSTSSTSTASTSSTKSAKSKAKRPATSTRTTTR